MIFDFELPIADFVFQSLTGLNSFLIDQRQRPMVQGSMARVPNRQLAIGNRQSKMTYVS